MGTNDGLDCERPRHRVWVDEFEMAAFQVTHGEYARYLQTTGAAPPPYFEDAHFNHPEQPVVAVSWFAAVAYCD